MRATIVYTLLPLVLFMTGCASETDRAIVGAAGKGENQRLLELIQGGADINAVALDGWTPLTVAIANGHVETASLLISHGADVNKPDTSGNCPLYWASSYGRLAVVHKLVAKGATVDCPSGFDPLITATVGNREEVVRLLLAKGANPDKKGREGESARELAHKKGLIKIVRLFNG
jgi:ankyrin repeat protein